jgi:hypothetical protein
MTHGYFTDKARAVFAGSGGNPDNAGALAIWAEGARARNDSRVGVVVAESGKILAQTRHVPSTASTPGATYITSVTSADYMEALNLEVGLAMGSLHRISGQQVIHVKYSEVAVGAGQHARATR